KGDPELQHAGDHDAQIQPARHATPPGKRQKHQRRQQYPAQYRKIAVDTPGQKFTNQAEREGPQHSHQNPKRHITTPETFRADTLPALIRQCSARYRANPYKSVTGEWSNMTG